MKILRDDQTAISPTAPARWRHILHLLLVAAAMATLALMPPRSGQMMLVPFDAAARDALPMIAINAGAKLVDHGILPGSLIVSGSSADLMPTLLRAHVLAIRAPDGGCGPAPVAS